MKSLNTLLAAIILVISASTFSLAEDTSSKKTSHKKAIETQKEGRIELENKDPRIEPKTQKNENHSYVNAQDWINSFSTIAPAKQEIKGFNYNKLNTINNKSKTGFGISISF